ncbi:hypothetical protein FJV46_13480 [Arthrobacter agilis]|uniref:hypothetical protein n=1 Tax=Arthrobacter agilis TaxID=37921 RepID=UPI000B575021|nr:hypothetical protein [Arthrobacter agilis]OUM44743.1 hypothetical protein B8W74_02295 [Arthrobacter agilis]PPB47068.1 hypothetical protein CI784_03325 [Arthrobacter agilis]TPV22481.1 hypothetical protein FJV46_13480 [Arthrobacter agilis]
MELLIGREVIPVGDEHVSPADGQADRQIPDRRHGSIICPVCPIADPLALADESLVLLELFAVVQ